jgi:PiT family inorganic phosphate transporter
MVEFLFYPLALLMTLFVAYNIGGATTGPAFGPAVGANVIGKVAAAGLMSLCFFAGAWTVGRRVVDTLGRDLLTEAGIFTLETSIIVLFFIGGALLLGNLVGAPSSTSMTAVGAIAGLGVAREALNWAVVGGIVSWWIVAPIIGFWASAMIGRYLYPRIDRAIAIEQTEGSLLSLDRTGSVPRPATGPDTTPREVVGAAVVVGIGCLMAFSSGTSNIANAIAPLVGSGEVTMNPAIIVGCGAVAIGAFTIARRTMDTVGNDITDMPLTAAIVVAVVSSTIVVGLSAAGIPASFVVVATMSIVGLGWGRATRTVTIAQAVQREETPQLSTGALGTEEAPTVGDPSGPDEDVEPEPIGDESPGEMPETADLFKPATTARVLGMQNVVPILATVGSFLTFSALAAL